MLLLPASGFSHRSYGAIKGMLSYGAIVDFLAVSISFFLLVDLHKMVFPENSPDVPVVVLEKPRWQSCIIYE